VTFKVWKKNEVQWKEEGHLTTNNNHHFTVIIQVNLQLEDFAEAKFYCPHDPADNNQRIRIREKMLELSSTHPFNNLFSRTTWVSQYQKGKTNLDLNEERDDQVLGWQWHQLDHIIMNLSLRDQVKPALKQLHWLPVEQRITYKLCLFMHLINSVQAPQYLSDCVSTVCALSDRYRLRSTGSADYVLPRTRTRTRFG